MQDEYKKLFQLVEDTLVKQEAQKLRGLNDYNMVNVVRSAFHEVGMHSNVIYSLINPNGLHYQNDLFLNLFIEEVLGFTLKDFGEAYEVQVEENTNQGRRIDFTIKSENYFVGIEMKVNARDLNSQISHYNDDLTSKSEGQKVLLYYLTKDGKDASSQSKRNVDIKRVSFKKHILGWLNQCQEEVKNITNLNIALEDYKNIVKKITYQYKRNVVSIEDELLEPSSKEYLKSALVLERKMKLIKEKVLINFFEDIENTLKNEGYLNINEQIKDKSRVVNEKKCREVFTKLKNKPQGFGLYFNCSFGDNLYFNVEYGRGGLFYGIIKLNESFEIQLLENEDKERFKSGKPDKKWKSRYWKNCGGIHNLDDNNILDFQNSMLKDEILKTIKDIQESVN